MRKYNTVWGVFTYLGELREGETCQTNFGPDVLDVCGKPAQIAIMGDYVKDVKDDAALPFHISRRLFCIPCIRKSIVKALWKMDQPDFYRTSSEDPYWLAKEEKIVQERREFCEMILRITSDTTTGILLDC